MAYLQVDLSSVSRPVKLAFKEFSHIETEAGSDVIIIAATPQEIVEKFRETQMLSAMRSAEFQYPTELTEISPDAVVNGMSVRERFRALLSAIS